MRAFHHFGGAIVCLAFCAGSFVRGQEPAYQEVEISDAEIVSDADSPHLLAFLRQYEGVTILVVANLSRLTQFVELDLSRFRGRTPVELFGQTRFPTIGDLPYMLTMGPYGFYWFTLESPHGEQSRLGNSSR